MRLLFDQNLSESLVRALAQECPGSVHVRQIGLERADDEEVWQYARDRGLTIVSKDADFHQRSLVRGHPPKVVWVRRGNCSTRQIEELLRQHRGDLEAFDRDREAAFLVLS